jgi:site-specific DNA recombinase
MGTVVAIYARYSRNPKDKSESTQTQLKRGREEAQSRWPGCQVREYSDDDFSGTLGEESRPNYGRMMADIRRGLVSVVLAKNQSRVARDTAVWDGFRIACLAAGIDALSTWSEGEVSHIAGRSLPGRIKALFDAEYVEQNRLNVLDHLAIYAREGRPPGGTCLGYTRVADTNEGKTVMRFVPDPFWAPIIRQAFQDVLLGKPVTTIAREWQEQGLPTARGASQWRPSTIRRLLISPTQTGLRIHVPHAKRKELGAGSVTLAMAYEHGSVSEGLWEPIVDRETFLAVQNLLAQPSLVQASTGQWMRRGIKVGAPGQYLWSGKFRCPHCSATMVGSTRTGRNTLYVCHGSNGGCGKSGVIMGKAEKEAEEQFLDYLRDTNYRATLTAEDVHASRRQELEQLIADIDSRRGQDSEDELLGRLSREDYLARASQAKKLRDGFLAELSEIPAPVSDIDPDTILLAWGAASTEEKRRWIALTVDYVEVLK